MKKLIISILFIICLAFGISAFAACGNSGGIGGNNIPTENQYNENITYKLSYTSEEECPNGNISDNKLHSSLNFEADKVYYLVLDFTVSTFSENWEILQAIVNFDPAEYITARLEEAATGSTGEREENGEKIITARYSIPEQRNEPKSYRVIYKFSGEQNLLEDGMSFNIGIAFITTANAIPEFQYWSFNYKILLYELNEETSGYTVRGFKNGISYSKLVIPKDYNGKPVTSIGNKAFYNCASLKSVTIPNSVTSIAEDAFYGCTSLTIISIPDSVTSIGDSAFGRTILTNIYIKDIASWCNIDFGSYDANPLSYAHNLYLNGQLVTNLDIPFGVTTIKQFAFEGCPNIESITIPDSVTSIGERAFRDCSSITSVTIGNGVTSIGEGAFSSCTSLKSVNIPNGVTSIGNYAFNGCSSITSVTIGNGVTSIGQDAFDGCSSLTSITIPDSVTSIDYGAFYNCTSLTSVTIGNGVTSIGSWAFDGCTCLKNITIPNSVTSLGAYAFRGCTKLKSVNIPGSVTYIGDYAFNYCTSLTSVTFENNSGWKVSKNEDMSEAEIIDLADPVQNAKFLTDTYRGYCGYYWKRA